MLQHSWGSHYLHAIHLRLHWNMLSETIEDENMESILRLKLYKIQYTLIYVLQHTIKYSSTFGMNQVLSVND